jgi:hypothetical protein
MARKMGFDFGLENPDLCVKQKHRWLFQIPDISASGIKSIPPSKAARPGISFTEHTMPHLTENIIFPGRPEWKTINLVLYETKHGEKHPIFNWLKEIYDPNKGTYTASCDGFKKYIASLVHYDGCGNVIEIWLFENIWPQNIEFGDVDMASADIITCDLTMRYDRAYIL